LQRIERDQTEVAQKNDEKFATMNDILLQADRRATESENCVRELMCELRAARKGLRALQSGFNKLKDAEERTAGMIMSPPPSLNKSFSLGASPAASPTSGDDAAAELLKSRVRIQHLAAENEQLTTSLKKLEKHSQSTIARLNQQIANLTKANGGAAVTSSAASSGNSSIGSGNNGGRSSSSMSGVTPMSGVKEEDEDEEMDKDS